MIPLRKFLKVATTSLTIKRNLPHPPILVPMVTQNTGRGERSSDIYSRLLSERIVCLMGPIHDATSSLIIAQLLFLQSESNHRPIHLYINSPGGSVTAGLGIYDTIQYVLPPVVTWCVGQACSMASLILASGSIGMRNSLPNSRIMIHQPVGGAQGQATDILIHAAEIIKLKNQINSLYAKHTGLPLERIESHIERDHFMDPMEAKQFGLIDNVLSSAPKLSDNSKRGVVSDNQKATQSETVVISQQIEKTQPVIDKK